MMRPTLVSIDHQRNLEEEKIVKLKGGKCQVSISWHRECSD